MPSRKVHQQITTTLTFLSVPLLFLGPDGVSFMAGVAVTWIPALTPDLDINTRHFGAYGEFIGLKAYAQLIPHRFGLRKKHWQKYRFRIWHMFAFSHIPFLGTLPRTALLLLPITILLLATGLIGWWYGKFVLLLWLGMSISDMAHVIADIITSDYKEMRRDFWRGRKYYRKHKV